MLAIDCLPVDSRILAEYRDVLRRRELLLDANDVTDFLAFTEYAEHVVGAPLPLTIPGPGDLPFLEVAVAAGVDAIVTGNTRHFVRARVNSTSPYSPLDNSSIASPDAEQTTQ